MFSFEVYNINILIGIIALVIAVSACIGLSIRQAAESAKESALDGMSVTATISYDRASAMGNMGGGRPGMGGNRPSGGFDPSQLGDIMGKSSSLSLEEYEKYAEAKSVEDFYYTLTATLKRKLWISSVNWQIKENALFSLAILPTLPICATKRMSSPKYPKKRKGREKNEN